MAESANREAKNGAVARSALIIDDDDLIRAHTRVVLQKNGFLVIEARDGLEGLEKAKLGSVDLILADLNMPVMNGLEMIEKIRALEGHGATPILVLTSEMSGQTVKQAKQVGATGWLLKPLTQAVLDASIRKLLPSPAPAR